MRALVVRTAPHAVEDKIRRERHVADAALRRRARERRRGVDVRAPARGLVALGLVDPHVAGRVDDRPRPQLVQRVSDRIGIGAVKLAVPSPDHQVPALSTDTDERAAERSARSDDEHLARARSRARPRARLG